MRHNLIGFLLFAMICGSKAEASYVCLEDSPELQPCNFERMQRATDRGDLEKTKITNGAVMESLYQAPEGTVVVYKFEGCIPRLPFRLPICKPEDMVGRVVEVRRLFPFVIAGDPPTAPLIFPEVEAAQLYKSNGDLQKTYDPVVSRQDLKLDRESVSRSSRRKKKLSLENMKKNRKHEKTLESEMMSSGMESLMPSPFKSKHFRRRNDIDGSEALEKYTRASDFPEAALPEYEFPYARAIHYDLETIRRLLHLPSDPRGPEEYTKHGSEFPYSLAIPFDPEKHRNLLHESGHRHSLEAPKYFADKSYDPLALEKLLMMVKRNQVPPSKIWKREVINKGTLFPYNEAVGYYDRNASEFRQRLEARAANMKRRQ